MILVLKTKNILNDSPVSFIEKNSFNFLKLENQGISENNPNSVDVCQDITVCIP